MKKQETLDQSDRILSRRLARELSKDQLAQVAGGWRSSTKWSSSSPEGEGDDGGADD
jgi:hypothetical protein